jgi:hypothetical protein
MDDEFDLVPDPGREAIIMATMLFGAARVVPGMAEGIRQAALNLAAANPDNADAVRAARRVIRIMDAPFP